MMLSRIADCLYWLGRYVERAENTARFAEVNDSLLLDLPDGAPDPWSPLVQATGDAALFFSLHNEATRDTVLPFLTYALENPNSIRSCIRSARENARAARDQITLEMWEQVSAFGELVEAGAKVLPHGDLSHAFFVQVRQASHLFHGVAQDTLSRHEAWNFLTLGQMLERADKTTRLLDVKYFILLPSVEDVGSPLDELQWAAVLRSASALEMYRKRHGRTNPDSIIAFLMLDREFPRSVLFCLQEAQVSLHRITGTPIGLFTTAPEQYLGQLFARLTYATGGDIVLGGLHEFLDGLQIDLNNLDRAINQQYQAQAPLMIMEGGEQ